MCGTAGSHLGRWESLRLLIGLHRGEFSFRLPFNFIIGALSSGTMLRLELVQSCSPTVQGSRLRAAASKGQGLFAGVAIADR